LVQDPNGNGVYNLDYFENEKKGSRLSGRIPITKGALIALEKNRVFSILSLDDSIRRKFFLRGETEEKSREWVGEMNTQVSKQVRRVVEDAAFRSILTDQGRQGLLIRYSVRKRNHQKVYQTRVMEINLTECVLTNSKLGILRKSVAFHDIRSIKRVEGSDAEFEAQGLVTSMKTLMRGGSQTVRGERESESAGTEEAASSEPQFGVMISINDEHEKDKTWDVFLESRECRDDFYALLDSLMKSPGPAVSSPRKAPGLSKEDGQKGLFLDKGFNQEHNFMKVFFLYLSSSFLPSFLPSLFFLPFFLPSSAFLPSFLHLPS
jgi:hypothetical protein